MTLKLIEGFDHVSSTGPLGTKGWSFVTDSQSPIGITPGRITGNAFFITENSTASNIGAATKSLPSALLNFVVGFAFQTSNRPTQTTEFLMLRAGSTNTLRICQDTTGHMVILNSGGSGFTGSVLNINTWYFLEVKVVINGASGSFSTQINGVTDIATTTLNFGSSGVDNIQPIGGTPPAGTGLSHFAGTNYYDDMYVLDTSASPNNNFLGDVTVETLYPSADGAHLQWTPDSGTAHFSRVNEHTGSYPDGDLSYVADDVSGDRDSYVYNDLIGTLGSVFAIQTNAYARKDDVGVRQINMVARPTTTDFDGAAQTLSTTYGYFSEIRETNPDTSSQWTIAQVNASEFGVKVT